MQGLARPIARLAGLAPRFAVIAQAQGGFGTLESRLGVFQSGRRSALRAGRPGGADGLAGVTHLLRGQTRTGGQAGPQHYHEAAMAQSIHAMIARPLPCG